MIADGDSVARNAFRVALRTDTPLPVARSAGGPLRDRRDGAATQELDPCDILEVSDIAEAIARAEHPMKLARSRNDMFASLGTRTTDDISGPATPAPIHVTPLPPLLPDRLLPVPVPVPAGPPPMSPEPPRYVTMPSAPEDDAYFHPAGRLRTLADATLENYRPEPTLLLRAASRRKRYSWVAVALLLPVVVLAAFEISARAGDAPVTTATRATTATKVATATPAPTTAPATPTVAATAATTSKKPPVKADTKAATPVFDVNSLPSAGGARPKPRR